MYDMKKDPSMKKTKPMQATKSMPRKPAGPNIGEVLTKAMSGPAKSGKKNGSGLIAGAMRKPMSDKAPMSNGMRTQNKPL